MNKLNLCFNTINFYYAIIICLNTCFPVGCKFDEEKRKLKYLGQDRINFLYFNF